MEKNKNNPRLSQNLLVLSKKKSVFDLVLLGCGLPLKYLSLLDYLSSLLRRSANARNTSYTPNNTGEKHTTLQALLMKPIFSLFANADKTVFFKTCLPVSPVLVLFQQQSFLKHTNSPPITDRPGMYPKPVRVAVDFHAIMVGCVCFII